MKKISIISQDTGDSRVLEDLLRAHFPGIIIENMPGLNEKECIDMQKLGLPENEARLVIERIPGGMGFAAKLEYGGKTYSSTEKLSYEQFPEAKISRERRLLRLTVYKAVSRYLDDCISPWGVLTGVRPTKIVHRLLGQDYCAERVMRHLMRDFGISPKKAILAVQTAKNQLPYLLDQDEAGKMVSLYIGIPFCPTRCHYCSFPSFSLQRWGHLLEEYLSALFREINLAGVFLKGTGIRIQSVYLGGGTPTLLSAAQLDRLLGVVEESFDLEKVREITVEGGRPDTLDLKKMMVMKDHRVTRLSINPQTMYEPTLEAVGRKHTVGEIIQAFEWAREAGLPVINMDLIIGLPGENLEILRKSLDAVIKLGPENITLHALAIKRAALYRQEKLALPNQKEGQMMMELAQETLGEAGYLPYYLYRQKQILAHGENVGYTLEGYPSLYNIQMMEERQTIIGFGVGAGSKIIDPKDWSVDNYYNPKDLLVYLDRLEEITARKVDKLKSFVYNKIQQ